MAGHRQEAHLARRGPAAAALAVLALAALGTSGPAGAADLPPLPTVPTTVPAVSAPSVTVPTVPVTVTAPRLNLRARGTSGDAGAPAAPTPAGAPAPTNSVGMVPSSTPGPTDVPAGSAATTSERPRLGTTDRPVDPAASALAFRLRRAAAETVQQLTFPLGLMLAMLAFVVFQHRVDKNDPRVTAALASGDDDLLDFS